MPPTLPRGNAAVGQSGGPTAVINESLISTVLALRQVKAVKKIYGMRHGVNGLVQPTPDVIELSRIGVEHHKKVAGTPAAALGSSRDKPDPEYCARILEGCQRLDIRYFFYIGGNDSSDTCRIINELAESSGYDMRCFHVPKTIDNDLVGSDHTPGFPSCARFQALAFMSDSLDNASLPGVKINVVMGRHAGFCTAAAAMAKGDGKDRDRNGPHLIYLPEVRFDSERFLQEVERVYARLGRCQVAVSEGIQDSMGRPIATTLIKGLDTDAHGNVQLSGVAALGDALSDLVKKNIKFNAKPIRVRADTFGYLQRCWPDQSNVDVKEARAVGRFSVGMLKKGRDSGSVAIVRRSTRPYKCEFKEIELASVAGKTRHMPAEFIEGTSGVTKKFVDWCRPLVGELPTMARL
jgi:6-phosphofructokinase 1